MNLAHGIVRATRDYEVSFASRVRVVRADLRAKHRLVEENVFVSVRNVLSLGAIVPALRPKLVGAPKVWALEICTSRIMAKGRVTAGRAERGARRFCLWVPTRPRSKGGVSQTSSHALLHFSS